MTSETMSTRRYFFWALPAALLAFGFAWGSDDLTPLRVSHVEGTAAYEPAGDVDWSEVMLNLPLLSGDRIVSHPEARVEIELGYANFLRMDENTDLTIQRASGREVGLDLKLGDIILRVFESEHYRVYTPHATLKIGKKGLYRVSVRENGETYLSVRKGTVEVENNFRNRKVRTGEGLFISGPQSAFTQIVSNYDEDAFDLWSDRRDAFYVTDDSVHYVGRRAGAYDLDHYGYWDSVGSYGSVWFPSVSVGWAPYRHGRWCYYPGYGWTWVSYERWGWLPYHYGDWVYYRPYNRWCWVPGGFGSWFGARVNFFFGSGYVGWAPYGYGYGGRGHGGRGHGGVTVINNNTTVVNNTVNLWNMPNRGGLTVVRQEDFSRGRPDRVLVSNPGTEVLRGFSAGLPSELSSGPPRRQPPERSIRAISPVAAGARGQNSSGPNVVVVGSPRVGSPAAEATSPAAPSSSWSLPGRSDRNLPSAQGEGAVSGVEGSVSPVQTAPQRYAPEQRPSRAPDTSQWSIPSRTGSERGAAPEEARRPLPPRTSTPTTIAPARPGGTPETRPSTPPRGDNRVVVPPQRDDSRRDRWSRPARQPQARPQTTPSRSAPRVTRPPSSSSRPSVTRPPTSRPRVTPRPSTRPAQSSRPPQRNRSQSRPKPQSKPPTG